MIRITIDEKACVGCSLCADVCPTGVFSFDRASPVPKVTKPAECFACLSCSEICPSTAIEHAGARISASFHRDPDTYRMAEVISSGKMPAHSLPIDGEGLTEAFADLEARLVSVARVFRKTLGNSLPAIGMLAGKKLAGQIPQQVRTPSIEGALAQFAPAWEIGIRTDNPEEIITEIRGCTVRTLCDKQGIEPGGELCTLFSNYLTSYLGKAGRIRLKLNSVTIGSGCCAYSLKKYGE